MKAVVKIPVIESEAGWGRKIDDYMVCLTVADAENFRIEFNSKNTEETVPEWYMQVEGKPEPLDITDSQFKFLEKEEDKRCWLSTLKNK